MQRYGIYILSNKPRRGGGSGRTSRSIDKTHNALQKFWVNKTRFEWCALCQYAYMIRKVFL